MESAAMRRNLEMGSAVMRRKFGILLLKLFLNVAHAKDTQHERSF